MSMRTGLRRTPTGLKPTELEAEQVPEALPDRARRQVLTTLQGATEPMTAQDLPETCDVPLSTTHWKVEQLSEVALLDEKLQLRANGTHIHQYRSNVESATTSLDDDRGLKVALGGDC